MLFYFVIVNPNDRLEDKIKCVVLIVYPKQLRADVKQIKHLMMRSLLTLMDYSGFPPKMLHVHILPHDDNVTVNSSDSLDVPA